MHDLIVKNARLYPMHGGDTAPSKHSSFAVRDGRVSALPASGTARQTVDAGGRVVLPGFIDCHTHALYAGDRYHEHAAIHAGESYADIAARGGGIRTTVRAVRAASEEELIEQTLPRLRALAREGVTGIEIKSGYGLDHANEIKMLRAIGRLKKHVAMDVRRTYLGAHTVPADTDANDYIDEIVEHTLPQVAREGLAEAVDIFVEPIAFGLGHMTTLYEAARDLGLALRVHAEQLSYTGAAQHAAHFGALSADHLEFLDAAGSAAMAATGTTAVLLPGAYYFLGDERKPPLAQLRKDGVNIAIATDLNPGSSPLCSLLVAAHMAVHLFGLTPAEALRGITCNAARAMGQADTGHLAPDAWANFSLWDLPAAEFLTYQLGGLAPSAVYYRGNKVEGDAVA